MTRKPTSRSDDVVIDLTRDASHAHNVVEVSFGPHASVGELGAALDAVEELVLVVEPDGTLVFANQSARDQLDVDMRRQRLLPAPLIGSALRGLQDGGEWVQAVDRRSRPIDLWAQPLETEETRADDDHPQATRLLLVGRARDGATDIDEAIDDLTGVLDRASFLSRVGRELQVLAEREHPSTLLVVDIDDFRLVSNTLGHEAGDQILRALARRLGNAFPTTATVGRVGGDAFAVFWPRRDAPDEATRRVLSACAAPIHLDGRETHLTLSTGVCLSTTQAPLTDAGAMLRKADTAASRAKQRGPGRSELFDHRLEIEARLRLEAQRALRQAIRNNELLLHYQPIVSLDANKIVGVEALLRWLPPGTQVRSPGSFMELAEETGLIIPMGRWVLEEACRQLVVWNTQFPASKLRMSINLSIRQLADNGFINDLQKILDNSGVLPGQVELEVTESVLMEDVAAVSDKLAQCRDLGVTVAIDDFGTGYSSLGYLRDLPADVLKIDRSFVQGIGECADDRAIVRAMVELARAIGLDTVAEGVETPEQLAVLRDIECGAAQGFHLARPQSASDLRTTLTTAPRW